MNADDSGSLRRSDGIDSSDVVLLEKPQSSQCDRSQKLSRDTITYETEKKHQSPSSKTPLLYAKNVQSYQESSSSSPQPISDQIQQKNVFLSHESAALSFYNAEKDGSSGSDLESIKTERIEEFVIKTVSTIATTAAYISADDESEIKGCTSSASNTNPFFNSTIEDGTVKEIFKGKRGLNRLF